MARTKLKLKSIASGTIPGRIKIANENITAGSVDSDAMGAGAISPAKLGILAQRGGGNRNLIHNGAMLVHQRGGTITLSGLTPNLDRFTAYKANDGTQTVEQSTDTPTGEGFKNSLKATNTGADASVAAGNRVAIIHRLEGQHCAHLMWGTANAKTVTLSFFVKSSITGTHGGAFGNGSDNRAYPFTYTISSANTWERKTITVPGDTSGTWATDQNRSIQICWGLGVGTTNSGTAGAWESADRNSATGATTGFLTTVNATWFLTGVQLEVGSVATAFEHEPFETTMRKCKRYYYKYGGQNAFEHIPGIGQGNASTFSTHYQYPVEMRTAPSINLGGQWRINDTYLGSYFSMSSVAIDNATTITCRVHGNTSSTIGSDVGRILAYSDASAKWEHLADL